MNIGRNPALRLAVDGDGAAEIALRALAFIAQERERVDRFLSLTGVDPGDLRELAPQAAFQLAVLDHLAGDEPMLLVFAEESGVAPELIGLARRALGGGDLA